MGYLKRWFGGGKKEQEEEARREASNEHIIHISSSKLAGPLLAQPKPKGEQMSLASSFCNTILHAGSI